MPGDSGRLTKRPTASVRSFCERCAFYVPRRVRARPTARSRPQALSRHRCFGLITDCYVEKGNPADSTLAVGMVERHLERCSHAPQQVCFDGAFASRADFDELERLEAGDVVFIPRARRSPSKRCLPTQQLFECSVALARVARRRSHSSNGASDGLAARGGRCDPSLRTHGRR